MHYDQPIEKLSKLKLKLFVPLGSIKIFQNLEEQS